MFLASNQKEFRKLFTEKLIAMLSPNELGAYILVLANSMQDDELFNALETPLNNNKESLRKTLLESSLKAPQDDLDVFEKLQGVTSDQLSSWSKHQIGVWEVMNNPFRALRPPRTSSEKITNISRAFDERNFNFNKGFLEPEKLWEGDWQSENNKPFEISVLYNKFPFIPYHLLIVPDAKKQHPQYLTQQYHEMIWNLVFETNQRLTGFGAAYNSVGACASVNHLHFQGFIRKNDFPIELPQWAHNGGNADYPMRCIYLEEMDQAWGVIKTMQNNNSPFNILYRPNRCYIIPRQLQGSATVNEAVIGAGWIEECGMFVATNFDEVEAATEALLVEDLKSLSM